jgi:hypothetical protein
MANTWKWTKAGIANLAVGNYNFKAGCTFKVMLVNKCYRAGCNCSTAFCNFSHVCGKQMPTGDCYVSTCYGKSVTLCTRLGAAGTCSSYVFINDAHGDVCWKCVTGCAHGAVLYHAKNMTNRGACNKLVAFMTFQDCTNVGCRVIASKGAFKIDNTNDGNAFLRIKWNS